MRFLPFHYIFKARLNYVFCFLLFFVIHYRDLKLIAYQCLHAENTSEVGKCPNCLHRITVARGMC
jgi:hypothetical protein